MARNICQSCGWDHEHPMWSKVNRHHFLDTGRHLSCDDTPGPVQAARAHLAPMGEGS